MGGLPVEEKRLAPRVTESGLGLALGDPSDGFNRHRPHLSEKRFVDSGLITSWAGGNFSPAEAVRDLQLRGKAHVAPRSAFGSSSGAAPFVVQ
jgi:hypothetical protein